ncbi:methyltransferase [Cumulibacter soli]|uniref:methyltransferase n=1 Tax=Cumulibacter soli TaxID=2546344 RepID=UPI001067D622|nr:class I SAM-dependent methyltransferase [Cumulibacter soli]
MDTSPPFDWSTLSLSRYPRRERELLLPYDGGDTYLLAEVAERHPDAHTILILGDRHGALSTALAGRAEVTMYSDSVLSRIATEQNLEANNRTATIADAMPTQDFDLVLARPGKARALLEEQLHEIGEYLAEGTPVVTGEMVKHLGRWVTEILERQIGPTTASLAHGKARLLRSTRDHLAADPPPWGIYEAPGGQELHNAPGTFATSGLDLGTRLLLPHLPEGLGNARVADLGCGNGVLAIVSAQQNPQASYLLVDESAAAIASADRSWHAAFGDDRDVSLVLGDGLLEVDPGSLDVVLCNPPFHAGHAVDEWVGLRLLEHAQAALRPGGQLYLVANRHLHYHRYLKQVFASVDLLESHPKFTVVRAIR